MLSTKVLFFDLDGTVLFSKPNRPESAQCIEYLQGKAYGFISQAALGLLQELQWAGVHLVPVTARSVAQYRRIIWTDAVFPTWVIVSNGGNLLFHHALQNGWRELRQMFMIAPYLSELQRLCRHYQTHPFCKSSKLIDNSFLCLHLNDAFLMPAVLQDLAKQTKLSAYASGSKVYVLPPRLSKGNAVRSFLSTVDLGEFPYVTAAIGDSSLDISMLTEADIGFAPATLAVPSEANIQKAPSDAEFSCWALRQVQHFFSRRML